MFIRVYRVTPKLEIYVYMRPFLPPSSENELHKATQLSKITRSFDIDFAIKIPLAAGTRDVNPRRELVRGDMNRAFDTRNREFSLEKYKNRAPLLRRNRRISLKANRI